MTSDLSIFAARLRDFIGICSEEDGFAARRMDPGLRAHHDAEFNAMALVLFGIQFQRNPSFRKFCQARNVFPHSVAHWTEIPAVPALAFKELELSCLAPKEGTAVFHSSGTTQQRPGRHFHSAESLAVYEASLWPWFQAHVLADSQSPIAESRASPSPDSAAHDLQPATCNLQPATCNLELLCPPPVQAPHSSLVYMFETVRRKLNAPATAFVGRVDGDGSWTLEFDAALEALRDAGARQRPVVLLGTAFSFVHLLDCLAEENLQFQLPPGSRVMETGGYKGRSRSLPKGEIHALITARLGIPDSHIVCEYGMSELSSQAYDFQVPSITYQVSGGERASRLETRNLRLEVDGGGEHSTFNIQHSTSKEGPDHSTSESKADPVSRNTQHATRSFHFPPWARAQIISPETGREVADGETGLLRVFDLANVFSVMAIQTEDLAIRRGDGFELLGRAAQSGPRGCSLLAAEP